MKVDITPFCLIPEKVSGYTLTVQASDNGSPPRVNTTTVNIDVSDVNDNAPVFSRGNYSVIIQVIWGAEGFIERSPWEMSSFIGPSCSFGMSLPKTVF